MEQETLKDSVPKRLGLSTLGRKKGVTFGVVVGMLSMIAIVIYFRIQRCNEECVFEYNPILESNVTEEQLFVTKEVLDGGMTVSYSISGFPREVSKDDEVYNVVFTDYFERTQISGSIPTYDFSIPEDLCESECRQSLGGLIDHRETLQLNEMVSLTVTYSAKDLTGLNRMRFIWSKLLASLGSMEVDLSGVASVINVSYETVGKAEVDASCEETASHEMTVEVADKMYRKIAQVMGNMDLVTKNIDTDVEDAVEAFFEFGRFRCDTCSGECYRDLDGVGLDYLFYPMLGAALSDEGVEIDEDIGLEVLATSYGIDAFASYGSFAQSTEGTLGSATPGRMWASESICLPYLLSLEGGDSSSLTTEVLRKVCFDVGQNVLSRTSQVDSSEYKFTDGVFFSYLDLLFEDRDRFEDLELVKDRHAAHGFVFSGMDNYIYGYLNDNESLVRLGNDYVVLSAWDVVHLGDMQGVDDFATKTALRKTITALLVKRRLANDPDIEAKVDTVLENLVSYAGDAEYITGVYDMSETVYLSSLDIGQRYLKSLSDLIPVWVLGRDFYADYIGSSIESEIDSWFLNHYMSTSCGKNEMGLFINYNSDGTCLQNMVEIRSNLSSMLYLMLITDDRV